jgi:hypothetical protein
MESIIQYVAIVIDAANSYSHMDILIIFEL